MEVVTEPERNTPILASADVVVVGGGPAGTAAALRASRAGASTIIIERFGSPGGTNTNGYMSISFGGSLIRGIARQIVNRVMDAGYGVDLLKDYPDIYSSGIVHYRNVFGVNMDNAPELVAYDSDMTSSIMLEMLEEAGVRLVFRSLFTDAVVKRGAISAVLIENSSGRQAVKGKVFIDATGRADVVAAAGAPFVAAGDSSGHPMPVGLMWKLRGVNVEKLLDYERSDPGLGRVLSAAQKNGDLPPGYRSRQSLDAMEGSGEVAYTGHPGPELMPTQYHDETLMWTPAPYEWRIDAAQNAEDATRAETRLRKDIRAEIEFLRKYVPGCEGVRPGGLAPMLGVREGRHPIGEYVLTYEDLASGQNFDDTVTSLYTAGLDLRHRDTSKVDVNVPYRCFLARNVENLLLAGDALSVDHRAFVHLRGFGQAMVLGEVAGAAAAEAIASRTPIKELWRVARDSLDVLMVE